MRAYVTTDELRATVAASAFHTDFGVEVTGSGEGSVSLRWNAREVHRNLQGLVHGGLLATLADMAMGLAVRTALEPGRRHVTIDLHVHYLRPAPAEPLTATGSVVRLGSQVAFAEAEVADEHGRALVRASGTYSVTRQPTGAQ